MADTPPAPFASLSSDRYDAVVTDIRFVLRRDADPTWIKRESVEHREFVMAYAISGRAAYRCGEEKVSISQGDLLLFPKGLRRLGKSDPQDPWTFFSVAFELHFADKWTEERFAALPYRVAGGNMLELHRLFSELERV
ncbi:MAG: AraC family ligand binding domain-containing protein, partial [Deinococcota bacterium]|nr:AraC family ligand binding domain-containing protein [Deinococcota bacterium]